MTNWKPNEPWAVPPADAKPDLITVGETPPLRELLANAAAIDGRLEDERREAAQRR